MVLMSLRLIIEDDEGSTTIVPLGKESITIGRQQGNTIQLTEKNVSRRHARLTPDGDAWVIEDLGSYNGVKVNGRPVDARVVLQEGDVVQIGDYHLALTEDVDRRSLNYDRPRGAAANDGTEPMLASSSTNLPRLSQAELAALSSGQHPTAVAPPQLIVDSGQMPMARMPPPYVGEEPRRRTGLFVGLGLVGIGTLVLAGFYVLTNTGAANKGPEAAVVAKADTKATDKSAPAAEPQAVAPKAEPTAPAPAALPTPAVAPPTDAKAADTPPAADDGGKVAAPPPESDDGDVVVDEPPDSPPDNPPPSKPTAAAKKPASSPSSPKKPPPAAPKTTPTPPPAPAVDADALLAEARTLTTKSPGQAYDLASKAYAAKKSQDAAFVMAMAACRMSDEAKARKAIGKLKGEKRDAAVKICAGKGITIE